MLPFGHLSAAYLIAQISEKNKNLKGREIWLVILAGIIFDFDFLLPTVLGLPGGMHHFLLTHTPVMGVVYWLFLATILRQKWNTHLMKLIGLALLSHLILDDLIYWLSLIGLEKKSFPQIFWFYPFDPRMAYWFGKVSENFQNYPMSDKDVLTRYLFTIPRLFYLEIGLTITAIYVFIRKKLAG